MKKVLIVFIALIVCLLFAGCNSNVEEVIKYVEVPVEIIVEKEVIKEVSIEVPVEVTKEVEVEKVIYETVEVEKIVEKKVEVVKEVEKIVEVEKPVEVVKKVVVEKEVITEVEVYKPYDITFADSDIFSLTPGTTFEYLAVYNCSNNTAATCYDSYVLGCYDTFNYQGELYHYCATGFPRPSGEDPYLTYTNFSCFSRSANINYSDYIVDCTNRTAPGIYDCGTGCKDWEDADYGMGVYILVNAKVEYSHQSKLCTYGGVPVTQVIISYDVALTPCQLLSYEE